MNSLDPARSIRTVVTTLLIALALVGCGANDQSSQAPRRSYTIHLGVEDSTDDYNFVARDPVDIQAGDEVTFELDNDGQFVHDLQVVDDSGAVLGTANSAPVGGTTSVTVLFPTAGTYRLNCNFEDHLITHQMYSVVTVTDPAP